MLLFKGELFVSDPNPNTVYLCTTNSIKCSYGLVMGRGSALEMNNRIPDLPSRIVSYLSDWKLDGTEDYGCIVFQLPHPPKFGYGIFQTKRHWRDVANLDTIMKSHSHLFDLANHYPDYTFRMPYPAVGCGTIGAGTPPDKDIIAKLMSTLPDNVVCFLR